MCYRLQHVGRAGLRPSRLHRHAERPGRDQDVRAVCSIPRSTRSVSRSRRPCSTSPGSRTALNTTATTGTSRGPGRPTRTSPAGPSATSTGSYYGLRRVLAVLGSDALGDSRRPRSTSSPRSRARTERPADDYIINDPVLGWILNPAVGASSSVWTAPRPRAERAMRRALAEGQHELDSNGRGERPGRHHLHLGRRGEHVAAQHPHGPGTTEVSWMNSLVGESEAVRDGGHRSANSYIKPRGPSIYTIGYDLDGVIPASTSRCRQAGPDHGHQTGSSYRAGRVHGLHRHAGVRHAIRRSRWRVPRTSTTSPIRPA